MMKNNDLNVFEMFKGKCFAWMLTWASVGLVTALVFQSFTCGGPFLGLGAFYGLAFFFKQLADNNRAAQNQAFPQMEQPAPQPPSQEQSRLFPHTRRPDQGL